MIDRNVENAATPEGMDGVTAITGASPLTSAEGNYFIDNAISTREPTSAAYQDVRERAIAYFRAQEVKQLDRFREAEGIDYADETCPCNNDVFGEGPCPDCRAGFVPPYRLGDDA